MPTTFPPWQDGVTPVNSANLTLRDQAVNNIEKGAAFWGGTATGSSNAFSVSLTPSLLALQAGNVLWFKSNQTISGAATLAVNGLTAQAIQKNGAALQSGDIVNGQTVWVVYDGTNFQMLSMPSGGYGTILNVGICEGRLTATTGVPVTTADVTSTNNLYWTPYKGNRIALYDGSSSWTILAFTEINFPLSALTANTPYDVFAYNNAGTVTLELLAWSGTGASATRATALTSQDGVLVKTGATSRRYLGTFYATSTTATADSAAQRFVWNYYNRTRKHLLVQESTASWNYTTATWRQVRAAAANKVECIIGVAEDEFTAEALSIVSSSVGGVGVASGIGIDSTSTNSANLMGVGTDLNNTHQSWAKYRGFLAAGYHAINWLEISAATGTTTWYGVTASVTFFQSGLTAETLC